MRDEREDRAAAVMAAEGLPWRVRSAGGEGEIAAISAPASSLESVRAVAPRLRALGYRYVALDLASRGAMNGGTR